ncbi:prepilin peptidase [Vallitalea okinawensis]|uniref:prepilin peptidase n=1 Tax=Vallitalea okinawensis TaxID=2078660 RepID=UPI000CFE118E|nr:prepilin peptidase [Vallitalea okinawensis]
MFKYVLLIGILALSAITDYKEYKVKNKYLLLTVLIACIYHGTTTGLQGSIKTFFNVFIPIIILFPLFMLKMLPAGDIKLFGTIAAIMGTVFTINAFILTIFIAGIGAIILMFVHNNFFERMTYLGRYIYSSLILKKILPYNNYSNINPSYHFPLSYFIFLGCIINIIVEYFGFYIFWA